MKLISAPLFQKQWPRTRTWASPETMLLRVESTGLSWHIIIQCCSSDLNFLIRFGKGSMYHKKAIYKFTKKVNKKTAPKKAAVFVEKQVGGAKNGGTRMVRAKKLANDVPTVDAAAPGTSKNFFSNHVRKVRASLTAGTVAIVLAGVHKGKRVVVLKQLGTGLLLVTGPHKLNGCPLR